MSLADEYADVIQAAVKLSWAITPKGVVTDKERAEFVGALAGVVAANIAKVREAEKRQ